MDGVAAEIDLAISPLSDTFSSVFDFNAEATLVFNTTGVDLGINIADRFMPYLSPRAKSRLQSPGNGLPATYYVVPGGAPLLNGQQAAPGAYIVVTMEGSLTLVDVFEMTGSFQMAFANSVFEVKFAAQMRLEPIGQVDASGILNVSMDGVYGALQLGGQFKLGPVEIFGAMQLELNTTGGDRAIERVQYDYNSRTVSPTRIQVTLPANFCWRLHAAAGVHKGRLLRAHQQPGCDSGVIRCKVPRV